MKLYIREKVFGWDDSFNVLDENGNRVFKCRGEAGVLGNSFEVTRERKTVAEIHEKLIKLRPKYTVEIGKEEFEVIKKAIGIGNNFVVKGLDWDISGDIINHKYEIKKGRETIAKISRRMVAAIDSYELNIEDARNALEVVCCAIAVDAIVSEEKKEKK